MHSETQFQVLDPIDVRRRYWELTTYTNEMARQTKLYARRQDPKGKRMYAFYREELLDARRTLNTIAAVL